MKTNRFPEHVAEEVIRVGAATIGFSLSSAAFFLYVFVASWVWIIPLTVLCLFSALESFLGFCAGCKIYGLLMRWQIVPEDHCPRCVLQ